jgi:hypothetical protein
MLTLTAAELRELTGYKPAAKQRQWLDERGVPYRFDGRVLVSRAAAEDWLRGRTVLQSRGVNLAAVT